MDFCFSAFYKDRSTGLHIEDDGRFLITGETDIFLTDPTPCSSFGAVRGNVFSSTEQSFQSDFGSLHYSHSSFDLPDGKLLQVGVIDGDIAIARRNANGTVDSTFGTGGLTRLPVLSGNDVGYRARLQPDGKILIAGYTDNGANNDFAVVRLDYDGALDPTFISNGSAALGIDLGIGQEYAYDVVSLPDGKILLAGRAGDDIALVRLLGDSDIISPTVTLAEPMDGSSVDVGVLNGLGYLDVTFADEGNSGLDAETITDIQNEITLSGDAAAGVTLDGAATLVTGSTYRYAFTGTFSEGPVSVQFVAGTFADQLGNANDPSMASFTVQLPQQPSADFDEDGDIDGRDFLAWQRGFGKPNATKADGDADNDMDVDSADLGVWQLDYGTPPSPAAATLASTSPSKGLKSDDKSVDEIGMNGTRSSELAGIAFSLRGQQLDQSSESLLAIDEAIYADEFDSLSEFRRIQPSASTTSDASEDALLYAAKLDQAIFNWETAADTLFDQLGSRLDTK